MLAENKVGTGSVAQLQHKQVGPEMLKKSWKCSGNFGKLPQMFQKVGNKLGRG